MKYLKFKAVILLLALTTLTGCLNDDENYCSQTIYPFITTVTGPDTALTGEEITLEVTFPILVPCGTFVGFNENHVYPKTIYAAVKYEGCNCSGNQTTQTEDYTFSADEPGEYVLKFANGANADNTGYTYITKTITVSDPD